MAETEAGGASETFADSGAADEGSGTGSKASEAGEAEEVRAEALGTELVAAGICEEREWEEASVEERSEWLARALMTSLGELHRLQTDFDQEGQRHDGLSSASGHAGKELSRLHKLNNNLQTMLEGMDETGTGRLGLWISLSSSSGVLEELRTLRELNKRSNAHARRIKHALEEERWKIRRLEEAAKKASGSEEPAEETPATDAMDDASATNSQGPSVACD